jgi:DNA repair exonuclease SbcCD ATPase subunit
MRIISLQAENIKRLKAVEITPEGDIVVIAGRNGQGKTSVLDSIWYALGGGPAQKETVRPIRDGEDHASVTLDLGKLVVTRTWKGETTSLKVMSKDGASYGSPQKMLDQLIGKLSFDPLAFTQQDQKTQLATLLDLVELPFDPDELADKRRALYDARTEVGREVRALEGQLAGIRAPGNDVPDEELSTAEIIGQQEAHAAAIVLKREAQQDEDDAERNIGLAEAALTQAQRELAVAKAAHEKAVKALEAAKLDYESLKSLNAETPEPGRIDFRERLASVEEFNRQVRAKREAARLALAITDARSKFDGLTGAIAELDASKAEALAEAKMPIKCLAFDDDGVTYNGIPFAQCSSGEQLRVSMAMAMAANPEIRVIRITDGSLLDSENMALIAELAKDSDFQVWIERVDETGKVGVIIEDGSVVGSP